MSKPLRLSIYFDGTGNNKDNASPLGKHTNVARLYDLDKATGTNLARNSIYKPDHESEDRMVPAGVSEKFYFDGVGSQPDLAWDLPVSDAIKRPIKPFEGGTGAGGKARIEEAYKEIVAFYNKNPGADIDLNLVGFSRGASQARALANVFIERGVPEIVDGKPSGQFLVPQGEGIVNKLAIFDTVASYDTLHKTHAGMDLRIHPNVHSCTHLVAANEYRKAFPLTSALGQGDEKNVEEIVCVGAHSQIGGGYKDDVLAAGPLGIMYQRLAESGVELKEPDKTDLDRISQYNQLGADEFKDALIDSRLREGNEAFTKLADGSYKREDSAAFPLEKGSAFSYNRQQKPFDHAVSGREVIFEKDNELSQKGFFSATKETLIEKYEAAKSRAAEALQSFYSRPEQSPAERNTRDVRDFIDSRVQAGPVQAPDNNLSPQAVATRDTLSKSGPDEAYIKSLNIPVAPVPGEKFEGQKYRSDLSAADVQPEQSQGPGTSKSVERQLGEPKPPLDARQPDASADKIDKEKDGVNRADPAASIHAREGKPQVQDPESAQQLPPSGSAPSSLGKLQADPPQATPAAFPDAHATGTAVSPAPGHASANENPVSGAGADATPRTATQAPETPPAQEAPLRSTNTSDGHAPETPKHPPAYAQPALATPNADAPSDQAKAPQAADPNGTVKGSAVSLAPSASPESVAVPAPALDGQGQTPPGAAASAPGHRSTQDALDRSKPAEHGPSPEARSSAPNTPKSGERPSDVPAKAPVPAEHSASLASPSSEPATPVSSERPSVVTPEANAPSQAKVKPESSRSSEPSTAVMTGNRPDEKSPPPVEQRDAPDTANRLGVDKPPQAAVGQRAAPDTSNGPAGEKPPPPAVGQRAAPDTSNGPAGNKPPPPAVGQRAVPDTSNGPAGDKPPPPAVGQGTPPTPPNGPTGNRPPPPAVGQRAVPDTSNGPAGDKSPPPAVGQGTPPTPPNDPAGNRPPPPAVGQGTPPTTATPNGPAGDKPPQKGIDR